MLTFLGHSIEKSEIVGIGGLFSKSLPNARIQFSFELYCKHYKIEVADSTEFFDEENYKRWANNFRLEYYQLRQEITGQILPPLIMEYYMNSGKKGKPIDHITQPPYCRICNRLLPEEINACEISDCPHK